MQFIDANVFIRFLTRDDPTRADRVNALLEQAQDGKITLYTSESVIGELVFVLSSPRLYGLSREAVRDLIAPLLKLKGLRLPDRETVLKALDLYTSTTIDFVDALAVAQMEALGIEEIYSYDRHFDAISAVTRIEP